MHYKECQNTISPKILSAGGGIIRWHVVPFFFFFLSTTDLPLMIIIDCWRKSIRILAYPSLPHYTIHGIVDKITNDIFWYTIASIRPFYVGAASDMSWTALVFIVLITIEFTVCLWSNGTLDAEILELYILVCTLWPLPINKKSVYLRLPFIATIWSVWQ